MPGKTGAEIDTAAHEIFDQEQVLPHVLHRTGHGLGLEHHEAPYSSAGDHTRLEPGMVVSVEPGIYVPKVGGFRHSDTVLVTNNGYRLLTRTPTDIDSMTIHNGWFRETRNRLVGRLVEKSLHFPPQELPMQPGASLMARGGCLGNPLRHTSVAMPLMTSGLMFCRPC
ncbi:MAG: M24 family peptidase [uncultured bacterium]|nr:MAG: M24 family peptidase [uncultured bacterium]